MSGMALADTNVSGAIAADTRWTLAGSPYVLSGAVTVQSGAALTIDPGVVVYMTGGASLNIATGKLLVQGEADKPVKITSDKLRQGMTPAAGDWGKLVLSSGASGSALSHADIAYGSGLNVEGAAVSLNSVRIQGHAGAAISADLAASLTGSGNEASGNQINAVVIPSGDILSSAHLGLRGIPYLVRNGVLSVGLSPVIDTLEPSNILAGESTTMTLTGKRLAGATQPQWSIAGLDAQVLAGATDTQVRLQVTAPLSTAVGSADLTLLTDAGAVTRAAALSVQRNQPHITSIEPASVYTLSGSVVLAVNGSFILPSSIVELDGQPLPTTVESETRATAVLPAQSEAGSRSVRLKTPDALNAGSFLTSNVATLTVVQAQVDFDAASASTLAGSSQTVTLKIPFDAPAGGLSFTLTSAAPAIATVTSTVTVPAGGRSAEFQVQGLTVGETQITVSRAGWAPSLLSVAVIQPPVSLAYDPVISHLVGVMVGEAPSATLAYDSLTSSLVGVSVGSHARQLIPAAGVVGTSLTLQVAGEGLNAVSAVQFVPSDGMTLGQPMASPDGKSLTVRVDIDASAAKSTRRVVLNTATGPVPFTTDTGDRFVVTGPAPLVESVSPNVLVAGQLATTLSVRGQNLRDVQAVQFVPAQGIAAISAPVTSADGTQMALNVVVDAAATPGARTIIVTTAGGESSASPAPGNTLQISREAGQTFAAISSPLVGVAVGNASQTQQEQAMGPYISAPVGVLVGEASSSSGSGEGSSFGPLVSPTVGVVTGAGAVDMTPASGATGTSVPVVVKGAGLQGVTQVQIAPADGVQVGGISASGDGSQVSFTVSIDANAPKTLRKVVLLAADTPVPFLNEAKSRFLVTGEVPVLDGSITPQVVVAGGSRADLTIRGRYLADVIGVSLLPPDGMSVLGIPTASADGSSLSVSVQAASSAAVGPRVVVVTTVAGQSSAAATAANTIQVVREISGTMGDLSSALVGVRVGDNPVQSVERSAYAPHVGLVVGPYVAVVDPAGVTKGSSGSLTISGVGLQAAASVAALPPGAANGVSLGVPSANAAGTELVVPYQISASAPSAGYRISVSDAQGQQLPSLSGAAVQWQVLNAPVIASFDPIVMNTGRAYTLVVRGSDLRSVQRIQIEPSAGITSEDVAMTWGSDALGEKLTLRLIIAPDAATGPRVIRLVYSGGVTSAQSTIFNTLNVTAP